MRHSGRSCLTEVERVWCSSVSAFRIFGKGVNMPKLGIVEDVLGYFMLCILIKVYLVGQSFIVRMLL